MLFILHQVNCKNAFGAGFAGYIAKCKPRAKAEYHNFCTELQNHGSNPLGQYCISYFADFAIVHIFSQDSYGNSKKTGIRYTDYGAMEFAISNFRMNHPNDPAICPQYMGCGLAGGDWDHVMPILANYNITWCSNINLLNKTFVAVHWCGTIESTFNTTKPCSVTEPLPARIYPFDPSPVPVKVTSTVDPTKLPTQMDIEEALF